MKKIIVCISDRHFFTPPFTTTEGKRDVLNKCVKAVQNQDYPYFSMVITNYRTQKLDDNKLADQIKNNVRHRAFQRKMLLTTDAEYFLLVDDDVIIPYNAVSNFMAQMGEKRTTIDFMTSDGKVIPKGTLNPEKFIIGGWYPKKFSNDHEWIGGRWVGDNSFFSFARPEAGLTKTDMIGLGCVLFKREVLEKVEFKEDESLKVALDKSSKNAYLGECLAFSNAVTDAGYRMYLDGSVICQHLTYPKAAEAQVKSNGKKWYQRVLPRSFQCL